MSNADLIERLRNTPNWLRESFGDWKDFVSKYDRSPFEAADALAAADKRIAELEQVNCSRLDEAERKLAVAREALIRIERCPGDNRLLTAMKWAEEALAQIGGDDAT